MSRSTPPDITPAEGWKQVTAAIGRGPPEGQAVTRRPNYSPNATQEQQITARYPKSSANGSPAPGSKPKTYWLRCLNAVLACRRKGLRGPRKAVLLIIARHMNKDSHTAWPSYELIAVETGLSRTAVANALTWLRESKILAFKKERQNRVVTSSEVNIYTIDLEQLDRGPMRQDACTRALDIKAEAKLATVRHTNGGARKRSE